MIPTLVILGIVAIAFTALIIINNNKMEKEQAKVHNLLGDAMATISKNYSKTTNKWSFSFFYIWNTRSCTIKLLH
jgi:hypothetical protein